MEKMQLCKKNTAYEIVDNAIYDYTPRMWMEITKRIKLWQEIC